LFWWEIVFGVTYVLSVISDNRLSCQNTNTTNHTLI
jgi:hypothetical protein